MDRPVRTCVGCRRSAEKSSLLRLVAVPGTGAVRADPRQRAPGRGAYLHLDPECHRLAVRRRSLGRALRLTGVDPQQVETELRTVFVERGRSA